VALIRKEFTVQLGPAEVWDAFRDVGAIHTRLASGFVVDTRLEGDSRHVTFAGGNTVKELIVDVDNEARRLVYSVVGGRVTHDNATVQVFADGSGSRIVWQRDLLPRELAPVFSASMDQGVAAMKRTLDRAVS